LLALLANANASAKAITDVLFTGPRLVANSARLFAGGRRLATTEITICSHVIIAVLEWPGPVPARELNERLGKVAAELAISRLGRLGCISPFGAAGRVQLGPETRRQLAKAIPQATAEFANSGPQPSAPARPEHFPSY
jgi:hypothetical protein